MDEQAKLTGFDDELRALEDAIRSKNSSITEGALEQQKLGHEIERFHKERDAASGNLQALEKEYDWIADESELFGRAGTPYDFKGQNMSDCKARRKTMQERFHGMKNKINPKVMAMIDSVEKKEASLKKNMSIVIKDKRKIEETIVKLDEYKKEALHKTWTKVNGDFGQIFNELLPGSFAKLDPPEGKTISDGLEVKVMLGKVWKQSLTELSGGQRYVSLKAGCSFRANRLQVTDRTVAHYGAAAVQASADVHSRRSRRRARSFAYTKHWPSHQDAVQGLAVHRRQPQGRHVPECEQDIPHEVCRRDQCCSGDHCG